jgi:hypothetical protein
MQRRLDLAGPMGLDRLVCGARLLIRHPCTHCRAPLGRRNLLPREPRRPAARTRLVAGRSAGNPTPPAAERRDERRTGIEPRQAEGPRAQRLHCERTGNCHFSSAICTAACLAGQGELRRRRQIPRIATGWVQAASEQPLQSHRLAVAGDHHEDAGNRPTNTVTRVTEEIAPQPGWRGRLSPEDREGVQSFVSPLGTEGARIDRSPVQPRIDPW